MARGFENLEAHSRKIKAVSIFHLYEVVFGLSAGTEVDFGAATISQFEMAGYEIGVEMRKEDVSDLEADIPGVGQVILDIALRINDRRGCTGLVSEQVRSVCKAPKIV